MTKDVLNYKLDTVYRTYTTNPSLLALLKPVLKFLPLPIVFLLSHFVLFFMTHLLSVISYHCFWINAILCVFYLEWAISNGANYYMDYFSKKYEKQLEKLTLLEEDVLTTPTSA